MIPCVILFTLEPFWLWFTKSRQNSHHVFPTPRQFGRVFSLRILLTLLLTASCITQVILNSNRRGAFGSEVFHYTLLIGTYLGVIVFECLDQWNNTANSPPIFLFWLSMGICQLPVLQTQVTYLLTHPNDGIFWVVSLAHYPIIILQLIVHTVSSSKPQVGDWSLEASASFPSLLCFTWMNRFICKGIFSPITDHFQIPKAPSMLDPSRLRQKFASHDQGGKLIWQIIRTIWKRLVLAFTLGLSAIILSFLPTVFLRLLILHCQNPEQSWKGYFFAITLFLGVTLESVVLNQFFKQATVLALHVTSGLAALIFHKTLKIPSRVRQNLEIGQIANLISNDIAALGNNACIITNVFTAPIIIVIAMILLCLELGFLAFVGVAIFFLLMPITQMASIHLRKHQNQYLELKDQRLAFLAHFLQNMSVLKVNSLEPAMLRTVNGIKDREVAIMKILGRTLVLAKIPFSLGPTILVLSSFLIVTLVIPTSVLKAEKIFVSVALFSILKRSAEQFPIGLGCLVKALVSFERISKFLEIPESTEDAIQICDAQENSGEDIAVEIIGPDLCEKLGQGESIAIYSHPNTSCQLPATFGGNGEQSNLQLKVYRPMSFAATQPWIQNDTMKSNILFGRPLKEEKYKAVLELCHLDQDLELLPQGDETDLGPSGINLNEDQKQRVSLARALYLHRDVCVLQSIPSNVDPQEIVTFLQDATVILFTQDKRVLSLVDKIISIDKDHSPKIVTVEELDSSQSHSHQKSCASSPSTTKVELVTIDNESCSLGSVSWRVYLSYIEAFGPRFVPFVLTLFLVAHGLDLACKYWLSLWAKANNDEVSSNATPLYYLCIYAAIGAVQGAFIITKDICLFMGCARASRKIHKDLVSTTLAFPLSFFKTNLFGNILNRFSIDISGIDDVIPIQLAVFLNCVCALIMIFIVIGSTIPIFIVFIFPLAIFYYSIHIIYLTSYRQLQRLNVLTRSELLNFISEITLGAETIRMFDQEHRIQNLSEFKVNKAVQSSYTMEMMRRWLALRLEFLGNLILFGTALLSVWNNDSISPSLVGLILSFSLEVTHVLNWLMRAISDLDSQFVALERIRRYQDVPREDIWTTEGDHGSISPIEELSVNIGSTLKFSVKTGEKLVVVDPSGGATRDLMSQMFRLNDSDNGIILLDGQEIHNFEQTHLRKQIRFVLKDPIIFPGAVRSILDPNQTHEDDDMRNVLSRLGMADLDLDVELNSYEDPVSSSNLWLLVVARFVLEPPTILFLELPFLKDDENGIIGKINPLLDDELRSVSVIFFSQNPLLLDAQSTQIVQVEI